MPAHPRPVTILMADDDPDDRLITRKAFEAAHITSDLRFVGGGEALMDYLHRSGKYSDPTASPRPAILLLDLNMPRKDGREALLEIKADPRLRQIRVIVLTTSRMEEDVARAYDVSAASFITKPAKFADLVAMVQALGQYWLQVVELPRVSSGG